MSKTLLYFDMIICHCFFHAKRFEVICEFLILNFVFNASFSNISALVLVVELNRREPLTLGSNW